MVFNSPPAIRSVNTGDAALSQIERETPRLGIGSSTGTDDMQRAVRASELIIAPIGASRSRADAGGRNCGEFLDRRPESLLDNRRG